MYSFLGFKTHTSSHFCSTHGVSDRLLGHRKSCWLQKHAFLLLRFGSEPKQGDWQWHSSTRTTPQPQLPEYLAGKPEYRLDPQQAGPRHGGTRGSGCAGAPRCPLNPASHGPRGLQATPSSLFSLYFCKTVPAAHKPACQRSQERQVTGKPCVWTGKENGGHLPPQGPRRLRAPLFQGGFVF